MHYRHPEAIIAHRTHLVAHDTEGRIAPSQDWLLEQKTVQGIPCSDLLATGVGGVLYPPKVFDEDVFDEQCVRDTSLMADDLWLLVHELRLGVPVVSTGTHAGLTYVDGTQDDGLYLENLVKGRNNEILKTLFERYPESEAALPVSYTHLDVYKRQAYRRCARGADRAWRKRRQLSSVRLRVSAQYVFAYAKAVRR